MYQKHIDAILAAWNQGSFNGADACLPPTYVRKAPASLKSDAHSLAEFKQVVTDFRKAIQMPRSRSTRSSSSTTGRSRAGHSRARTPGAFIGRFAGGKMTEELVYFDALEMFGQLGLMAVPG